MTEKNTNVDLQASQNSSLADDSSLPNSTDFVCADPRKWSDHFYRWRPQYHVMPSHGWVNDPCAPGYNEVTGFYHLAFQWNPKGNTWGNIAWGVARSQDLVHWKVSSMPSIEPSSKGATHGIFTGSMRATNYEGEIDGSLTCFYTAAQHLPIHYTLPYISGSETVHIAISRDDGRTWKRHAGNPVVASPPGTCEVTAWRDPYVTRWESMDRVLGKSAPSLYGLITGGLKFETPTIFLYEVDSQALDRWTYVFSLVNFGLNFSPSRWCPDFGVNFEVANLVTLRDSKERVHDIMIVGVEGVDTKAMAAEKNSVARDRRQMWFCGALSGPDSEVHLRFRYGGCLDYGCLYATNSFWDSVSNQYVAFGWIQEDLSDDLVDRQNWCGSLSIPRVLGLKELTSVSETLKSPLTEITSVDVQFDAEGTATIYTLAIMPDIRLQNLRGAKASLDAQALAQSAAKSACICFVNGERAWELEVLCMAQSCSQVGLEISHSNVRYSSMVEFSTLTSIQAGNSILERTLSLTWRDSS